MQLSCKMCGGNLVIMNDSSVCECEYCGSRQTVPRVDDDKKENLFARANRIRLNNEFDKAAGIYESIVVDFPEEAEAYWGLVLCKYGIEYVDDPLSGRKVPTCHRSSYTSIYDDNDYYMAVQKADSDARELYISEAKQIEEIRKGIIEVSNKEQPYDIFICYKETSPSGERTIDSVIAQEVYEDLIDKGYRVFFSRITLEDKLGVEYEPYIFAALNSAKVMLVFGTDYDYFDAVWVKNEWSRFLKLMAENHDKYLIPCYKNMDVYDIPKEFAKLQAQDMGKVGAKQDLLRGIEKIIKKKEKTQRFYEQGTVPVDVALERAQALINLGNYDDASKAYSKISQDFPSDYRGWWGQLICEIYNPSITEKNTKKIHEWYGYSMKLADDSVKTSLKDTIISFLKSEENKIARNNLKRIEEHGTYKDILSQIKKLDELIRNSTQKNSSIVANRSSAINKGNFLEGNISNWDRVIASKTTKKTIWLVLTVVFLTIGIASCSSMTSGGNTTEGNIMSFMFFLFIAPIIGIYKASKAGSGKGKLAVDLQIARTEYAKNENYINVMNQEINKTNDEIRFYNHIKSQYQEVLNEVNKFKSIDLNKLGKYYITSEASSFGLSIDSDCDSTTKALGDKIEDVLKNGTGLERF